MRYARVPGKQDGETMLVDLQKAMFGTLTLKDGMYQSIDHRTKVHH